MPKYRRKVQYRAPQQINFKKKVRYLFLSFSSEYVDK